MTSIVAINSTVKTRLSALVVSKGVSIADLADAIGSDEKHAKRLLEGVKVPTVAELVMASRFLGVTSSNITGEVLFNESQSEVR